MGHKESNDSRIDYCNKKDEKFEKNNKIKKDDESPKELSTKLTTESIKEAKTKEEGNQAQINNQIERNQSKNRR